MYTITWVPKRDRTPKWARWSVLNESGDRVAYFEKLGDAISWVYYMNIPTTCAI